MTAFLIAMLVFSLVKAGVWLFRSFDSGDGTDFAVAAVEAGIGGWAIYLLVTP